MNRKSKSNSNQEKNISKSGNKRREENSGAKEEKNFVRAKWYSLCVLGMAFVIIFALFGPQIVFKGQDCYRLSGTEVQNREHPDVAKLNLTYEKDINVRMNRFAQREKYYVTDIAYDSVVDEETLNALHQIMEQEFIWYLFGSDLVLNAYYDEFTFDKDPLSEVTELKKYIIYGDDFNEGVALMAWYFDDTFSDGTRIQCLADTETYTIYYLRVLGKDMENDMTEKEWNQQYKDMNYIFDEHLEDLVWNWSEYYNFFYQTEVYKQMENMNDNLQLEANGKELMENTKTDLNGDAQASQTAEKAVMIDADNRSITVPLEYEAGTLHFYFRMTPLERYYNPSLNAGIEEIGQLIPEFTSN